MDESNQTLVKFQISQFTPLPYHKLHSARPSPHTWHLMKSLKEIPQALSTGIVHSFTQPASVIALTRTGSFSTIITEQCRAEREME
jgi:hypothetical protein